MSLTAEQLEQRRTGIGGSDAGAILGLNPYRTAVDVYLEKRGELFPDDLSDNEAVHFGNVLEDVIAQEYTRRTGNKVRRRNTMLRHVDHAFMLANLDRSVDGLRRVLECKTAGQYTVNAWGPSGTDQVPDSYLAQCMHYMIVTGYDQADLAVLIGGRDFRIYHIPFDRGLADMIIAHETEFWRHVNEGVPPPPQNVHDLETLYAIDNGDGLVASPETAMTVDALKTVREQIKHLEAQKEQFETDIKGAMKDYSALLGADGLPLVTWKKAKDSARFDARAFEKKHPDLHQQFLVTQSGSRRFLVK